MDLPYSLDVVPDSLTELAVNADYGLSVLGHREAALRFALFVMSPEGQHLIGLYGFTPVAPSKAAF
jgi:molybdate transport system substrate-binding protein